MKNLKLLLGIIIICKLANFSVEAQTSPSMGVIFKTINTSKLKFGEMLFTDLTIYGTEENIKKYIYCQDAMSGKAQENFNKLEKVPGQELAKQIINGNALLIRFNKSADFLTFYKNEINEQNKYTKESRTSPDAKAPECKVISSICIGNKEASFSIGCENGIAIEISTSGTLKLSAERNGKTIGVDILENHKSE